MLLYDPMSCKNEARSTLIDTMRHQNRVTRAPPLIFKTVSRETVRKGVRATLRAWIWQVYGGQTGPKSTFSVARKATLQAPPRLFGQFLQGVFSETRRLRGHKKCRGLRVPALQHLVW